VGKLLDGRRTNTDSRIKALRHELQEAEGLCTGKACVYAIGSFGRGEASEHSDLDLFIAGTMEGEESSLRRLDQILLKAELIKATRKLKIPDFSGDGEYLDHYTVDELVKTLGTPEDDVSNTFTARLLLLLESRPLLENSVYSGVVERVIEAYWQDYKGHESEFMPAFLANDILRLWRTFCVNYEARSSTEPERKKAKRKLKNYKLKHSRLLTCYSGLLYLLAVFSEKKTVSQPDAIEMIRLSPTRRLEWLLAQTRLARSHPRIAELIEAYERFLADTDATEDELVDRFLDKSKSQYYRQSGNRLGNLVFEILEIIGERNAFHRLLVV
jgi:predicted nucleotidyltransferase